MMEPTEHIRGKAKERLKTSYESMRDEYLDLCWEYNLPPRDLSLSLIGRRGMEARDRIRLIRLIIRLMDLEKLLGPDVVDNFLFAVDEAQYLNSAIFPCELH